MQRAEAGSTFTTRVFAVNTQREIIAFFGSEQKLHHSKTRRHSNALWLITQLQLIDFGNEHMRIMIRIL